MRSRTDQRARASKTSYSDISIGVTSPDSTEPIIGDGDAGLKRRLGVVGLTAVGFSNIIGAGWLLPQCNAAQSAARRRWWHG